MPGKKGTAKTGIPFYQLEGFRSHHRRPDDTSSFGYNNLSPAKMIPGFELYSSAGIKPGMGPLKSAFYRINITISGTLDIYIGLEHFQHQPCTVCFTYPGQVFAKSNISADAFGYYMLFNPGFLDELVPHNKISTEFPFLDVSGMPFFRLSAEEINRVESFVLQMDEELLNRIVQKENSRNKIHVICLCGDTNDPENREFMESLNALNRSEALNRVRIHGCPGTPKIAELVSLPELFVVISKPGGSTVNEMIKKKVPMIYHTNKSPLDWEKGNMEYGESRGLGKRFYLSNHPNSNDLSAFTDLLADAILLKESMHSGEIAVPEANLDFTSNLRQKIQEMLT